MIAACARSTRVMALDRGPTRMARQVAQNFGFRAKSVEIGQRDLLIPLCLDFCIRDTKEMDGGSLADIVTR